MARGPLSPDLELAPIARRQHGLWSRRQAIDAGCTKKMVRTRLASGAWLRVDTGVYAHAMSLPTWERSVMAAVLAEPWAVPSHRTAAVVHGLDGFRRGRPEITVRPGANTRGKLAVVHRGVDVPTCRVGAFTVTSLAHTFIDLAQHVSHKRLRKAVDGAVGKHAPVLDDVRDRYAELAPRGGRNLRSLKAALLVYGVDPPCSESQLERRLRSILEDPCIPEVLGDGRAWHTRVEDFERDRRHGPLLPPTSGGVS